jgi:hypothetical protein
VLTVEYKVNLNVAFGIESDGFAAACGLQPLAEPTAQPAVASGA